jgi:hypothetical protein
MFFFLCTALIFHRPVHKTRTSEVAEKSYCGLTDWQRQRLSTKRVDHLTKTAWKHLTKREQLHMWRTRAAQLVRTQRRVVDPGRQRRTCGGDTGGQGAGPISCACSWEQRRRASKGTRTRALRLSPLVEIKPCDTSLADVEMIIVGHRASSDEPPWSGRLCTGWFRRVLPPPVSFPFSRALFARARADRERIIERASVQTGELRRLRVLEFAHGSNTSD